jgi:hypothetical protein
VTTVNEAIEAIREVAANQRVSVPGFRTVSALLDFIAAQVDGERDSVTVIYDEGITVVTPGIETVITPAEEVNNDS